LKFRIPFNRVNWTTSSFLIGTFLLTLTAVPLYLWHFGVDWFYFALFAVMLSVTGFSITLGYHRLFSHMTFRARLPVRLFTLIFGAAAFENSVLIGPANTVATISTSTTTKIPTTSAKVFSTRTLDGSCSSCGRSHLTTT